MALVTTRPWNLLELQRAFGQAAAGGDVKLHLYEAGGPPSPTVTPASFTEATIPGYAPISLVAANWVIGLVGGIETAVYPFQTWTFTGTGILVGYYVTDPTNAVVYWSEAFTPSDLEYGVLGGQLDFTPTISLQ